MQRYFQYNECGLYLVPPSYSLQVVMCKEKATGEILALTKKRVLHNLEINPFLLVCQPFYFHSYIYTIKSFLCLCVYLSVCVCTESQVLISDT